ncbi:hypothetical protein CRYUN_Cryun07bG0022500 [Craigia yunnanensis]
MYASTLQLLVCLCMLIHRCVYESISKDDIQKIFPDDVLPELQRLLTLLLQKFQREWQADIHTDEVSLPRLKAMTWNMATQDTEVTETVAVINLKLSIFLLASSPRRVGFEVPISYNAEVYGETANGVFSQEMNAM